MEIKIVEQRPNPLLKRTEYRFELGHEGQSTPSRDTIRAELAKDLKVPKEQVVVEEMHSKFGTPKTVGEAMVYRTLDDAKAVEREHILIRNRLVEKPGAVPAGAASDEAAPAAPAEPKAVDKPAVADAPKVDDTPKAEEKPKASEKPEHAKPAAKSSADKPKSEKPKADKAKGA